MPRDFASISSPIRTRHRRISGLHRWEPTCPPRTPHGASLSLETVAHLQLLLDTPSRVPGSLSVPRSSWYSRSAPLPHRCRIPFVRAPGQDLRLPALTSDLLAMPVTLLDDVPHRLRRAALHLPARRSRQNVNLFLRKPLGPTACSAQSGARTPAHPGRCACDSTRSEH